ncbi:hypothetical protein BO86DRAFT_389384 [Aspergillus japonicus CBS 114.51]|uniref:Uncharacterized protein n=1 Tax=Aspergillus japonicus CBS 114.51 TaxID=1448312 RepID=A0A8T8X148_ASPJA|nr:hypothetical protein BO86DRAFT_389384 [Aspergillus japonicus CBS 114.51]RAH81634.1 hypothetical protein BO86DRAFT_389384 [Aspergillus japonicus CBS 114.51]
MTPLLGGAKTLLRRRLCQTSHTAETFPFYSLRLVQKSHRPSFHRIRPQLCTKKRTLQPPQRSLSSSTLAVSGYQDSKCTPWRRFNSNPADVIEKHMLDWGHRTWGLVIYRCTYSSDADWEEFMSRLLYRLRSRLEHYYDGLDMLDSFQLTVMDDKARFDGANPDAIRGHFDEWAPAACEAEQGILPTVARYMCIARYGLCIMVDEEALRSVLAIPHEDLDTRSSTGFVILVHGRHHEMRAGIKECDEELEDDDF